MTNQLEDEISKLAAERTELSQRISELSKEKTRLEKKELQAESRRRAKGMLCFKVWTGRGKNYRVRYVRYLSTSPRKTWVVEVGERYIEPHTRDPIEGWQYKEISLKEFTSIYKEAQGIFEREHLALPNFMTTCTICPCTPDFSSHTAR